MNIKYYKITSFLSVFCNRWGGKSNRLLFNVLFSQYQFLSAQADFYNHVEATNTNVLLHSSHYSPPRPEDATGSNQTPQATLLSPPHTILSHTILEYSYLLSKYMEHSSRTIAFFPIVIRFSIHSKCSSHTVTYMYNMQRNVTPEQVQNLENKQ